MARKAKRRTSRQSDIYVWVQSLHDRDLWNGRYNGWLISLNTESQCLWRSKRCRTIKGVQRWLKVAANKRKSLLSTSTAASRSGRRSQPVKQPRIYDSNRDMVYEFLRPLFD